ncbi:MAG: hypothetical protein JJT78_10340, partial [Leptospira sp.]|nr:hypothetical protein [Leptospira sp.]
GIEILNSQVQESTPVILQGANGFSLKDFSGLASHYYSIPELTGQAGVYSNKTFYNGKISLWLDREFSSKFMQKEKSGWDWVHFTMDNGDKFLAFQIREESNTKTFQYGILIRDNKKIILPVSFTPKKFSRLSSQNTYPTEWEVLIGKDHFRIKAMIYDSEMKGLLPYWEGPIQVQNLSTLENGKGYLEMTGYGKKLPDWL